LLASNIAITVAETLGNSKQEQAKNGGFFPPISKAVSLAVEEP
jgi:hypothetical protein